MVDDGSPDSTGTLCDELASADPASPRCTVQTAARCGPQHRLDAATGDWVLFLDADDELLPGLWDELAALDDTAQKADLLLFHLCRASGGDTTGVLAPAFTRICPHWVLRWSRCCLPAACWRPPTPNCSAGP